MICTIGGQEVISCQLWLRWSGAWSATVQSPSDTVLSGKQTLLLGSLALVGTIEPTMSGVYNNVANYRIVAGAGGWGKTVPAKNYHNDLGVKLREVLADLGNACGETVTTSREDRLSVDYLRREDKAGLCLLGLIGKNWYVAPNGTTVCDARSTSEITAEVQLLKHNPITKRSSLFVDDLASISVGSILRSTPQPQVIRSIFVETKSGSVEITAEGRDL